MAQRIDAYTGGIDLSAQARSRFDDSGSCLPFVTFSGKCLDRNQEKMFEIISELLQTFNFSDQDRLKNLLLEYRAGMESMIVRNGHRLAISLASRHISAATALDENWNGIHQLKTIKQLTEHLTPDRLKSICDDLTSIGRIIITGDNFKAALIGEAAALSRGAFPWPLRCSRTSAPVPPAYFPPRLSPNPPLPPERGGVRLQPYPLLRRHFPRSDWNMRTQPPWR